MSDGARVDCKLAVPNPIDSAPIRSPQEVHTLIASKVHAKQLVEIGTRNGDGISCFSKVKYSPKGGSRFRKPTWYSPIERGLTVIAAFIVGFLLGGNRAKTADDFMTVKNAGQMLGVSSLMKDFGCGFTNMGVPPFLVTKNGGHRVMVDIGLNTGEEALAAAKSGFVVYAFEPVSAFVKDVVSKLKQNDILYHHAELDEDNGNLLYALPQPTIGRGIVYIFQAAAGSRFGKKTIFLDGPGSSFVDEHSKRGSAEEVLVVPVSAYIERDVYYLKIDAQGWESEVFLGLLDLLRNHVVRLISVEIWPKGLIAAGSSPEAITTLLIKQLGYLCFDSLIDSALEPLHEEGLNFFTETVKELYESSKSERFGFWDDLTCLSPSFATYGKN